MDIRFDLAPRFEHGSVRRGVFGVVGCLLFAGLALTVSYTWLSRSLPQYLPRDWAHAHDFDALVDWNGARLFTRGVSPYVPEGLAELGVAGTGHPPTTPFWFLPLAGFEKGLAAELIGLSVWLCLGIHVYLCAKALRIRSPFMLTLLVWSFMIASGGMLMHFWAVQLSEHIAFAYVLSWWYLRRGQDTRAGVMIGIAATLKLFPGVAMLFFLFAGRFRAFVAASLTFVSVAAVMTHTYGLESWPLFFKQQGPIAERWFGSVRNAGLQGVVLRMLSPACDGPAVANPRSTAISIAIAVLLLAAAAWMSWKPTRIAVHTDSRAIDVPFALFALLSVFLNPWVWEHYTVLLIQPAFVICVFVIVRFRGALRAWLDEELSHRRLAASAAALLFGVGGVIFTGKLLLTNIYAKERLLDLWFLTKNPWYHLHFHIYEAINYLPWVILIALCFMCLMLRPPQRA